MQAAKADAVRIGPLVIGYVDQLTDAKEIAEAERSDAVARQALAEAESG